MTPPDAADVVLTFMPLPDPLGVPLALRVRQLLRYALRAQRLRCVSVAGDLGQGPPPADDDPKGDRPL